MIENEFDILIVGGGASGFFTAIQIAEQNPNLSICILEQSKKVLEKVKISGGGRCNVTNICSDPKELVKNYPRGNKNLLNIFYAFNTTHTIRWFEGHNIQLKTESDGRVFPKSNTSQTIIDCFLNLCHEYKINIQTEQKVVQIKAIEQAFHLQTLNKKYICKKLVLACSTNKIILDEIEKLNISTIPLIPSLFSFNTKNLLFKELAGITLENCTAQIVNTKIRTEGNILITHTGVTGPCILKLSAYGAKELFQLNYNTDIIINWNDDNFNDTISVLSDLKISEAKKKVSNVKPYSIPNRFWNNLLAISSIDKEKKWADLNKQEIKNLAINLSQFSLRINGKSTNKDEFVTAGGISLQAVNMKTMQSKQYENLYFTGEILDIDGITGGFNFQAAWSTAYLAAKHIASLDS